MFRTHYLIAIICLPLILTSCSDDSSPPSGPRAEAARRPAVRAADTAVQHLHFQVRDLGARALFDNFDPSTCVETGAFVSGTERAQKEGPGKPITGPLAVVEVFEFNFCTNELVRDIFGTTDDAIFEANRNKLAEARLQATIPAIETVSGAEVQVNVDLTWTGSGEPFTQSDQFRIWQAGFLVRQSSKGTFRPAEASGTVAVGGENFGALPPIFAEIFRLRFGDFEMLRSR
jgi:hypothetical protein